MCMYVLLSFNLYLTWISKNLGEIHTKDSDPDQGKIYWLKKIYAKSVNRL